jgi:hypothetical protein
VGEVNQWLCGCVVSNLEVSNFQNEPNKFLKNRIAYYTSKVLFSTTFQEIPLGFEATIQLPCGIL